MSKLISILLIFFSLLNLEAQSRLDSLISLSNKMMMTDRDSFFIISKEIINIAKEEGRDSLLIKTYQSMAMVHFLAKNYETSLLFYDSIMDIADPKSREYIGARVGAADIYPRLHYSDSLTNEIHLNIIEEILPSSDSLLIAAEFSNYGNFLINEANYHEGADYLIRAIGYTPTKQSYNKVMHLYKLARIFLYIEDIQKADLYIRQANDIAESKNYKVQGKNIALLMGRVALNKNLFSQADSLLETALKNFQKAGSKDDVFSSYLYLANSKLEQGQYKACQIYLDSASVFKPSIKNNYTIGKYYHVSARNDLAQKYYSAVRKNLDSLLVIGEKTQNIFLRSGYLQTKAELERSTGNYEESLDFYLVYQVLRDSVLKFKTKGILYDLESKYQNIEKQEEIELLKTKNELISFKLEHEKWLKRGILWVAVISLLFLAFLGITIFKVKEKNKLIRKTATQKDILLKEIHHRVKNNLQLISSLLNLQERYIKDEKAKEVSIEGQTRVRAMSLIHQSLYRNDDLINLSLDDYFKKLVKELFDIYHTSTQEIKVKFNIDPFDLDVDRVIPLGLIFNELITNVLKYAFPDGRKGNVVVNLNKKENMLIMEVIDDGIGIDDIRNISKNESFGFTLVEALLSKWKGKLDITSKEGTHVRIEIISM